MLRLLSGLFCLSSLLTALVGLGLAIVRAGEPAAAPPPADPAHANWTRVTEHAPWQPRDSCGEVAFRDHLWLLGGWFDSYKPAPRDVWRSPDGIKWELVTDEAPWKHSDLPMTCVFDNRMWIMGGWQGGRLPGASSSSAVWHTTDGRQWQLATPQAGWSPRLAAGLAIFDGKMWITGGIERYYDGDDHSLKNDVWFSSDGREWHLATEHAPWSPRAYHAAVAHDGKLWVMGGGNYVPNYAATNDVWSSPDGVNWTRVTEHAPWPPRIWFSAAVHRGQMWVLGGWSNNPFENHNDVWHSSDGERWEQLATPAVWERRHEHSAYVFDDKLWVVAGHAQPLRNDVWRLDLPPKAP